MHKGMKDYPELNPEYNGLNRYTLTVQYKGGSGLISGRDSLTECFNRLEGIRKLEEVGGVVIKTITIRRNF